MANARGFFTARYLDLHTNLADYHVGLIFTGHCAVSSGGRHIRGLAELTTDGCIPRCARWGGGPLTARRSSPSSTRPGTRTGCPT
jgi:2,4-dienoyl-CoA reductase-like NADH-dependent reductase (Old Yellow Enzyme family)